MLFSNLHHLQLLYNLHFQLFTITTTTREADFFTKEAIHFSAIISFSSSALKVYFMQLSSLSGRSRDCKKLVNMEFENMDSPRLELKLKLSPPRDHWRQPNGLVSLMEISPQSSCVSRETSPDAGQRYSSSPEANSSMMLVGCPRCLMYVMLLGNDPKCPKCKSTVLLDFLHEDRARRIKN